MVARVNHWLLRKILKNAFLVSTGIMCLTQITLNNTPRDCTLAVAKVYNRLLRKILKNAFLFSTGIMCFTQSTPNNTPLDCTVAVAKVNHRLLRKILKNAFLFLKLLCVCSGHSSAEPLKSTKLS